MTLKSIKPLKIKALLMKYLYNLLDNYVNDDKKSWPLSIIEIIIEWKFIFCRSLGGSEAKINETR